MFSDLTKMDKKMDSIGEKVEVLQQKRTTTSESQPISWVRKYITESLVKDLVVTTVFYGSMYLKDRAIEAQTNKTNVAHEKLDQASSKLIQVQSDLKTTQEEKREQEKQLLGQIQTQGSIIQERDTTIQHQAKIISKKKKLSLVKIKHF